MQITQKVHCPNCGSYAERYYFTNTEIIRTQCSACDYLMINCSRTGKVIEAYAPGIYAHRQNIRSVVSVQVGKGKSEKDSPHSPVPVPR